MCNATKASLEKESTRSNSWRVRGAMGLMLVSGVCNSVAILIGSPISVLITSAFAISAVFFASYVVFDEDHKSAKMMKDATSSKVDEKEPADLMI